MFSYLVGVQLQQMVFNSSWCLVTAVGAKFQQLVYSDSRGLVTAVGVQLQQLVFSYSSWCSVTADDV